jgi:hypothetical protein
MSYLHGSVAAAAKVLRRHAHARAVDGWGRCRAVGSAGWTGVVLRATPTEANARVANGIALHLVDGHFSRVTLHELHETTSLAWWDLDVGDFTKALEEGTELILGDITRETTHKDSCVVWVGELVHRLGSAVVAHGRRAHRVHAHARATATLLLHAHAGGTARTTTLVLGCRSANAHRAVATIDALHFSKGLLLVLLASKSDEAIAARHSGDGVRHDLGRLGGLILVLEQLDKDKLGDLGAQVAHEDGILGTALVAANSAS